MAKKNIATSEDTIIDKEKIEKEIKKEVKDVLLEDLEKQVDILVQSKLDKIERKINKQKQRSLLKKNVIIIILLALVIFEGKVLYDNGLLNNQDYKSNNNNSYNQNTDTTNESVTNEDNTKDKEWYIQEYSYLLDNVKTNLAGDDLTYLYNNNYKVEDLDNKVKLNMAYQLLTKDDISKKDGFLTVDAAILEEAYKTIFGNELEYKNENFTNDCIHFMYNESLDKYLAVDLECAVNTKEVKEQIVSVEEKDKNIIVTTVLGIYDTKEKTISNLDNTFNKKYKEEIVDYEEELDKFEYEFIKVDDTYYFSSITKQK